MKIYNCAVFGSGYMAQRHIKEIKKNPRTNLVIQVHKNKIIYSELSTVQQIEFDNFNEMMLFICSVKEVDVFFICTPDHTHCDYVMNLLNSKKPIFCEKPLGRTEEEFTKMIEAGVDELPDLLIGMNCRFRYKFDSLKKHSASLIRQNTKTIRGKYFSNISAILDGTMKNWWFEYPKDIKPFLHGGAIHLIDLIRFVVGEIEQVYCIDYSDESSSALNGDCFYILAQLQNGLVAILSISGTSITPNTFDIEIELKKSELSIDLNVGVDNETIFTLSSSQFDEKEPSDMEQQLSHYIDVLDGIATPVNNFSEAYKNFRVINACELSIKNNSAIKISKI